MTKKISEYERALIQLINHYGRRQNLSHRELAHILRLETDEWIKMQEGEKPLTIKALLTYCGHAGVSAAELFDLIEHNNVSRHGEKKAVLLKLYASPAQAQRSNRKVAEALAGLDPERFKLFVFDPAYIPELAKMDDVTQTPVLIREEFEPVFKVSRLTGELPDPAKLRQFILGLRSVQEE